MSPERVRKCVLIVDDHAGVRTALRALLEANDVAVCGEAMSGAEAIDKAKHLSPDLIILDLSMPVMNGLQAARVLSAMMPNVPLLLLTNYAERVLEREAQKAGIRAVIAKSDAPTRLMESARELLA
jgi:DNA-binding NarL/FixJ family response regulator